MRESVRKPYINYDVVLCNQILPGEAAALRRDGYLEGGVWTRALVVAGVVMNLDAVIGRNSILNTGCTVDHDCIIGDHAHLGPGVNLCGGVRLGDGVLMGVGSCAIPRTRVGEWATVGAGSAVVDDVPPREVWGGVPARPLRRNGDPE